MVERPFLRSINIQMDVEYPERVEHFRPTTKSVGLISSMVQRPEGNSVFVVAPYGSGKSIASAYVGHLVENRPEAAETLRQVEDRLVGTDVNLAKMSRNAGSDHIAAVRSTVRTLGVNAHRPEIGHSRSDAAGETRRQARTIDALRVVDSRDIRGLLNVCMEKMAQSGRDRIVIVWDEFGRHLQGLVSEGRPEDLDVLQVLAEVVSRARAVPVSLGPSPPSLLAGLRHGLPAGLRREWAKIEGRFETLQYLDDSAELYELIGSLVREKRPEEPSAMDFGDIATAAKQVGLFPNLSTERLVPVLASAYPVLPTTLHLLHG